MDEHVRGPGFLAPVCNCSSNSSAIGTRMVPPSRQEEFKTFQYTIGRSPFQKGTFNLLIGMIGMVNNQPGCRSFFIATHPNQLFDSLYTPVGRVVRFIYLVNIPGLQSFFLIEKHMFKQSHYEVALFFIQQRNDEVQRRNFKRTLWVWRHNCQHDKSQTLIFLLGRF